MVLWLVLGYLILPLDVLRSDGELGLSSVGS